MEGKERDNKMVLSKPTPSRPTTVRISCPTTTLASFPTVPPAAADHYDRDPDCRSFSELLAGAMASSPPPAESPARTAGTSGGVALRPKTVRLKPLATLPPPPPPPSPPLHVPAAQKMPAQTEDSCAPAMEAPPEPQASDNHVEAKERTTVVFKPLAKLGTMNPALSSLANLGSFGISHQQALAQVQAQARAQAQVQSQPVSSLMPVSSSAATFPVHQVSSSAALTTPTSLSSAPGFNAYFVQQKPSLKSETKQTIESPNPVPQNTEQIQRSLPPIPIADRPSFDGYNWRKYGQKQVKGSEYPRSYYKCTHPNCPVKKKVERSHDGQITEIVYKGEHSHLKPQPTRRLPTGSTQHPNGLDVSGREMESPRGEKNEYFDVNADQSSPGFYADPVGRTERLALTNVSDPSTPARGVSYGNGSPELSPCLSDDGEGVNRADDEDDDEPVSKRRKKDKKMKDLLAPERPNREPRVVVQTSDADILEDGFRWRKYGQKVVKGNPYPRSYYKCTSLKCTVRKHVERASDDPKAVITTYEGKHNHDPPVARNSNQDAAGISSAGLSGNGANAAQEKQIQNRLTSFARVSQSAVEGEDRMHVGEVGGVQLMRNNRQSHGEDIEKEGSWQ
uniref:WRKY domain-containing protein n=1 Tax=Picea sitchensis TaxID=3332 RepID=B8LKI1_PICSI|nr:unknown [Picea sitchensis]